MRLPEGDDRLRYTCDQCGTVFYQNPKIVAGALPTWEDKILICRRAIEPSVDKWTLPAGYLENGETIEECAIRETREEAGACIKDLTPYAVVNLPDINQVYFMFRARLEDEMYSAGAESREVKLVHPDGIPWEEIAFASIREVLKIYYRELREQTFSDRLHQLTIRRESFSTG